MTAVEAFLQRAVDLLVSQRQQWGGWLERAGYLNLVYTKTVDSVFCAL